MKSQEVIDKQKMGRRGSKKEEMASARNSVMAELANNLKRSSSNLS